jgi:glycosyltransferase involved in cell wall biosynthesis
MEPPTRVKVSVVVPTYRRPDLLGRCLAALGAQDSDPSSYEIIIVDDAASDHTRRQVEVFAATARPAVRYVAVTGRHGPAAARNAGWRAARGGIVAFTDDDCIPDGRWLAEGVRAFEGDVHAVTGRVVVPLPESPTDYERDAAGLEGAEFVTANCFCLRPALEAVGGFDERFTAAWREDSDLQFTLIESGRRIGLAPAAVVVHPVRPAPWAVSLNQQRKVFFDALLYKKHPRLYRLRLRRSPPWNYYAIVASLGLAAVSLALGGRTLALASLLIWAALTARFCVRRLRRTSRSPRHVAEMAFTSLLIPPLSIFWRLYGAWRFQVPFA